MPYIDIRNTILKGDVQQFRRIARRYKHVFSNKVYNDIMGQVLVYIATGPGLYVEDCNSTMTKLMEIIFTNSTCSQRHKDVAMEKAATFGYDGLVKVCLKHGANPQYNNADGFVFACYYLNTEVVRMLAPHVDPLARTQGLVYACYVFDPVVQQSGIEGKQNLVRKSMEIQDEILRYSVGARLDIMHEVLGQPKRIPTWRVQTGLQCKCVV